MRRKNRKIIFLATEESFSWRFQSAKVSASEYSNSDIFISTFMTLISTIL